MKYVIQRIEDGKFVAPPGAQKSYTTKLQHALLFDSKPAAQREACDNERVLSLDDAALASR